MNNDSSSSSTAHCLSLKIAEMRKKANLTQEQLADQLGLSFQAISKWENGQSCPDILLLPELSRIFGITIDEMLGCRLPAAEPAQATQTDLPLTFTWPDDQTLRLVLLQGHRIVKQEDSRVRNLSFTYHGAALNVTSQISITCDDIAGTATAGLAINCGDISGNGNAGKSINCGDIGGDCNAGGDINCGDIGGDCKAGRNVKCGDVGGDCHAEGDVECGDVEGNCSAGGKIN